MWLAFAFDIIRVGLSWLVQKWARGGATMVEINLVVLLWLAGMSFILGMGLLIELLNALLMREEAGRGIRE